MRPTISEIHRCNQAFNERDPYRPKRKLTCSGHATNSLCWRRHRHGSGSERLDLHSVAKVGQTFDQALFLLVGGTAIEVIAAEAAVKKKDSYLQAPAAVSGAEPV